MSKQPLTPEEFAAFLESLVDQNPDKPVDPESTFKIPCDEESSREIIGALASNLELTTKHLRNVKPMYFVNEVHGLIWRCLSEFVGEYGGLPSRSQMMAAIHGHLKDKDDEVKLYYLGEFSTCHDFYRDHPLPRSIDSMICRFLDSAACQVGMFKILEAMKKGATADEIDLLSQELLLDKRKKMRAPQHAAWIDLLQFRDRAEGQRPEMIVAGWLQEQRLHLITGREKSGKSTLLWCLITSLLSGRDWLGMPCKQSPVVYLDFENGDDYAWDNIAANLKSAGINPEDVANLWRTPGPIEAGQPSNMPGVLTADWLRGNLPLTGLTAPPVVIVDAAGPAFGGLFVDCPQWDNSRSEVHRALAPLKQICHEGFCTILLIHHNNKQDEFLGSVAWRSECDHCWAFKRPEGANRATLSHIGRTLKQTDALAIIKTGDTLVCEGKVFDDDAAAKRFDQMTEESALLAVIPFGSQDAKNTTLPSMLTALGGDWTEKRTRNPVDRLITAGRVKRHREKATSPYLYWREMENS